MDKFVSVPIVLHQNNDDTQGMKHDDGSFLASYQSDYTESDCEWHHRVDNVTITTSATTDLVHGNRQMESGSEEKKKKKHKKSKKKKHKKRTEDSSSIDLYDESAGDESLHKVKKKKKKKKKKHKRQEEASIDVSNEVAQDREASERGEESFATVRVNTTTTTAMVARNQSADIEQGFDC